MPTLLHNPNDMAELMHEIEWSEPLLPQFYIPEWEKEVKAKAGSVPDIFKRVSRSVWLRETLLRWPQYQPREFSEKLSLICGLVTAQENTCRYCYGVGRSQMKLMGYSEKLISDIERETQLAELDTKERAFVQFCRKLSRSTPRPSRSACDKMVDLGYSEKAVAEMAFLIVNHCFTNRVSTFISIPPLANLENLSTSFFGKIFRPLIKRRMRNMAWTSEGELDIEDSELPGVVRALKGLPAAKAVNDTFVGAFMPSQISQELKVLMFAVVARTLACSFCEEETKHMAIQLGFKEREFEEALQALDSPRLDTHEKLLLSWTRNTIHYQNGPIQRQVRELAKQVDEVKLLEAIGIASLANSVVRLAILLSE